MLSRTSSGLLALHRFYGCDFVVFVEGGYAGDGEIHNDGDDDTPDTMFWQRMFKEFARNPTFYFKSMGSKSALLHYVKAILEDDIPTLVVCMDRDFDHVSDKLVMHPRILYTRGYSWENDISLRAVLREAFLYNCTVTAKTKLLCEEMLITYDSSLEKLGPFVFWDYILLRNGQGLFPRDGSAKPVLLRKTLAPDIDVLLLEGRVSGAQTQILSPNPPSLIPCRDVYGHCIARLAYHSFVYFMKKANKKYRIDFDGFVRSSINHLMSVVKRGEAPEINAHYEKIIGRILSN